MTATQDCAALAWCFCSALRSARSARRADARHALRRGRRHRALHGTDERRRPGECPGGRRHVDLQRLRFRRAVRVAQRRVDQGAGRQAHLRCRHRSGVHGVRADRHQRLPDRGDRQRLGLHDSAQHPLLDRRAARAESKPDPRLPEAELLRDSSPVPPAAMCPGPTSSTPGKWRGVACPKTYYTRTKANGDLECWKFPPECSAKVGNPVNLLDGCKAQRELDYRSRTPGGLEVERFYNSGGYFRFDVAPERSTDVWRTTWDRRIVPPPVAGAVLAYAQRADGSILVFLPSGREMHNGQGGGSALLQRLDRCGRRDDGMAPHHGRAATSRPTMPPAGCWRSTLRAGWTLHARLWAERQACDRHRHLRRQAHVHLRCGRDASSGFVAPGNRAYVYGYDARGRLVSRDLPGQRGAHVPLRRHQFRARADRDHRRKRRRASPRGATTARAAPIRRSMPAASRP